MKVHEAVWMVSFVIEQFKLELRWLRKLKRELPRRARPPLVQVMSRRKNQRSQTAAAPRSRRISPRHLQQSLRRRPATQMRT
jgi:hypothetical protein